MSKSLGNVVAPQAVMDKLGADILRLWVASTDYSAEMAVSDQILTRTADSYRRIRNTARFLLANLNGFDPLKDLLPNEELLDLDRWDFPLGPYPPPAGATFDVGARFDAIATKPHDFALYNYYAVDFEAWRLPDVGRRAVDAVLGAAADTPPRRYLDQILSMTTLGRIRVALDHIIDAAYVADAREDDCAHSWALEALCLATGRVLNLDGLSEVLEIIDEELRCPPFVDALPFDLPASHTGTPGIAHATNASLRAHVETLDAHIEAGAFGEKENATRYREILDAVARAELGLIYIGW